MKYQKIIANLLIFLAISQATSQNNKLSEEEDLLFQTYFFEALKNRNIENYQLAIENLEKCYKMDTTNVAVDFEFSKNFYLLKKYFEANIFIEKALDKDPFNLTLLEHKVCILQDEQKLNEAIVIQEQICKIQPVKLNNLVVLYMQANENQKALETIKRIEDLALITARTQKLKELLQIENSPKTEATSTTAIEATNNSIEALRTDFENDKKYNSLKKLLEKEIEQQNYQQLLKDVENGLAYFPAQPLLYKIAGLAYNNLLKYNEALNVLTTGINFVVENIELESEFYDEIAKSYKGLQQPEKEKEYKNKALKLRNENK